MCDERGVVDGKDRGVVVRARRHEFGAGGCDRFEQQGRSRGDLGAGLPHPEPNLAAGLVQQAVAVPHDGHALKSRHGIITPCHARRI
jgi:hypothetical protein